jgi:hypothetical protein
LDHPSGRYDFGVWELDGHVQLILLEVGRKLVKTTKL